MYARAAADGACRPKVRKELTFQQTARVTGATIWRCGRAEAVVSPQGFEFGLCRLSVRTLA